MAQATRKTSASQRQMSDEEKLINLPLDVPIPGLDDEESESAGISSADDIFVPEPELIPAGRKDEQEENFLLERPALKGDDKPRAGPPILDEWQNFFSNTVIRLATNFYIEAAFRGIDEDRLTDSEIERIRMTQEERERIGKPFSEFANKNKWLRKHGRMIISTAGMSDSFIALGMWYRRVNRIARKYRVINVSTGPSEQAQANGYVYGQQRYFSPGG